MVSLDSPQSAAAVRTKRMRAAVGAVGAYLLNAKAKWTELRVCKGSESLIKHSQIPLGPAAALAAAISAVLLTCNRLAASKSPAPSRIRYKNTQIERLERLFAMAIPSNWPPLCLRRFFGLLQPAAPVLHEDDVL